MRAENRGGKNLVKPFLRADDDDDDDDDDGQVAFPYDLRLV